MESLKNAISVVLVFSGLAVALSFIVNNYSCSGKTALMDTRWEMDIKNPNGKKLGKIRMHADVAAKPNGGFFVEDIKNDMILSISPDGDISYSKKIER